MPTKAHSPIWRPTQALVHREIIRFYRQRSRVIGSLATPLVFWLVLGSGFGKSFRSGIDSNQGYLEYFFPGILGMILLFTAIFSTISIIEDRNEGFLQGVLVAPVSRASIVLGKIFGATILALIQALIFMVLAPFVGISVGFANMLGLVALFALVGFGLTALGFWVAWRMESIQGFHSIMNLVLLPMWLLSGAAFPISGASGWISWLMKLNPLTYGMAAIRRAIYYPQTNFPPDLPSLALSLFVIIVFGGTLFGICLWEMDHRGRVA